MPQLLAVAPGFLTSIALRTTLLLLATLALSLALRRAAAAARRGVWAVALSLVLALPALTAVLPEVAVPVLPAPKEPGVKPGSAVTSGSPVPQGPLVYSKLSLAEPAPSRSAEPGPGPGRGPAVTAAPSWPAGGQGLLLLLLWCAGGAVVLRRIVRSHRALARLTRAARPLAASGALIPAEVRESDDIDLPMTVGLWRSLVLLPTAGRDWSPGWRRAVIAHEAAHVRARDCAFQFAAELACAVHWFNPLVWWAAGRLRVERELAADDAVLAAGNRSSDYALCLIGLATGPGEAAPVPGAVGTLLDRGGLKARLLGLLDGRRRRRVGRGTVFLLAAVGGLVLVPVASWIPGARPGAPAALALTATAPQPGHGPIIGRAVEAGSGRPIAGAEVDLTLRGHAPSASLRIITDAEGLLRAPSSPVDRRLVTVAGYLRKGSLAARTPLLSWPIDAPRDFELRPAATLSGVVRNEAGVPIAGAAVTIFDADTWGRAPGATEVTDRAGGFRLPGILNGNYRIVVEDPRGSAAVVLAHVESADVNGLEVTVPSAWPISGRLVDGHQRPVAGALVEREGFYADRRRHHEWDRSAADGSFSMLPLGRRLQVRSTTASGELLLATFSDRGEVNVVEQGSGQPSPLVWRTPPRDPYVVVLEKAAYLSGEARTADGTPVADAVAHAMVFRSIQRGAMMGYGSATARTGRDGRFTLGPLPPGLVQVGVSLQPPEDARPVQAMTQVKLAPGESRTDLALVLPARFAPPPGQR